MSTSRGAVGTPAYMAPEQARDTHQASAASDVYALGATLLFAATGHPPYQGDSVMDVLARLATEEPDLIRPARRAHRADHRLPAARPAGAPDLVRDAGPARAVHRDPARCGRGALLPARRGHGPDRPVPAEPPAGRRPARPVRAGGQRGRHLRLATPNFPPPTSPSPGPGQSGAARGPGPGWRRWVKAHLAWVGWVSVGAALVVGGVILGASLTSSGSSPAAAAPAGAADGLRTVPGRLRPDLCMVKRSEGDRERRVRRPGEASPRASP